MQTIAIIMQKLPLFLYGFTVAIGILAIVAAVHKQRHGPKELRRNICFKEIWRIKLDIVNKGYCRGSYYFRYWNTHEGKLILEASNLKGDIRRTIVVSVGELFKWKTLPKQLRGWYVFDGINLIKYKQINK